MNFLGPKIDVINRGTKHSFVGVKEKKDHLIITHSDCVTVYDHVHKKITNSWTIGKGQRFTSPVIYNDDDGEYVAVINFKIIKTFTDDIDKGDKFTINSQIFEVSSNPARVVFSCGIISSLNDVLADPKSNPASGLLSSQDHIIQLISPNPATFMIQDKKEAFIAINDGPTSSSRVPFQYSSLSLLSVCVFQPDDEVTLISFWSDGSVCSSTYTSDKAIQFKKILTLPMPSKTFPNMMTALKRDCLAVITGDRQISIVDIKFGIVHETLPIDEVNYIKCLGDYLLIVGPQSVCIRQFNDQPITLSSVLGKHQFDSYTLPTEESWEIDPKIAKNTENQDADLIEVLLKSNSSVKLQSTWKKLWKGKTEMQCRVIASSSFMSAFMTKLTESEQAWMPKVLKMVVTSERISARVCRNLISSVLEHKDDELLLNCFQHVADISERDIVRVLNKLLPSEYRPFSDQLNNIICELLQLPYTEISLVHQLRHLQFERAMVLISHLSFKLKTAVVSASYNMTPVITWISLLIDAHFAQIIVTSEAWQLLVELQEIVAVQMELYKELSELDAMLNRMRLSIVNKQKEQVELCGQCSTVRRSGCQPCDVEDCESRGECITVHM